MPYLLAMVEMIEPNHGLRAFTVLLEDMLAQEVDFRVEAHNRERLAAVLERSGRSARSAHADVQLPRVFWELCREGLMVQELAAAAVSLQDKAAVEAAGVPFVLAVAELAEVDRFLYHGYIRDLLESCRPDHKFAAKALVSWLKVLPVDAPRSLILIEGFFGVLLQTPTDDAEARLPTGYLTTVMLDILRDNPGYAKPLAQFVLMLFAQVERVLNQLHLAGARGLVPHVFLGRKAFASPTSCEVGENQYFDAAAGPLVIFVLGLIIGFTVMSLDLVDGICTRAICPHRRTPHSLTRTRLSSHTFFGFSLLSSLLQTGR